MAADIAAPSSGLATSQNPDVASATLSSLENSHSHSAEQEIVFLDGEVEDLERLAASISKDATIVMLNTTEDPIAQITSALKNRKELRAIHLISHGGAGELRLAGRKVDLAKLCEQQMHLSQWKSHLADNADILLYGCDVAAGTEGQRFVRKLSELTEADVAASIDITGSTSRQGNWTLETQVGPVETGVVVARELQASYLGILKSHGRSGARAGSYSEDDTKHRRYGDHHSFHAAKHHAKDAVCESSPQPMITVVKYDNFADMSEMSLNGSATSNGCGLELTPSAGGLGSAFASQTIAVNADTSFRSSFQFQIDGEEGSAGADGFVFMLQNNQAGMNAISRENGESLGYTGIDKSIAIEFDTFHNMGDINDNHVSVFLNGDTKNPLVTQSIDFDLNDGSLIYAWVEYDGKTNELSLYLCKSDVKPSEAVLTAEVALNELVGDQALAGFSAATGSHVNRHQILKWQLETTQPSVLEDKDVILEWTQVMENANAVDHGRSKPEQGGPILTARAFAMVTGAMYDAYNSIHPIGSQFEFTVKPTQPANVDAAVAQVAHDMLVALYPSQQATFHNELAKTLGRIENGVEETEGRRIGAEIAKLTMQARSSDDMDSLNDPNYKSRGLIGFHDVDPLNPRQGFYGTGAADIQPFVIANLSDFSVPALDDGTEAGRLAFLMSDAYTEAYNEVKMYGGNGPDTLRTAEQTEIGIYWGYDGRPGIGTPPRLYNQIVREVAIQEGNTEAENARLFALVNIAQADAGLATWDAKYINDFWRPALGVRNGEADGNAETIGDENWSPLGAPASNPRPGDIDFTPNFPAYTSGHATFGAAVFETLENFYGTDDIGFSFISDEYNGKTLGVNGEIRPLAERTFNSFTEAKVENAISRIYLGVHWRFDATEGIDVGDRVADYVFANSLLPFTADDHVV
jgi:hypothetical protein